MRLRHSRPKKLRRSRFRCEWYLLFLASFLFGISWRRQIKLYRSSLGQKDGLDFMDGVPSSSKSGALRVHKAFNHSGTNAMQIATDAAATGTLPQTLTLMHIGKTGGTTLRKHILSVGCRALRNPSKRTACLDQQPGQESQLSKITTGIMHYQQTFPSQKKAIEEVDGFIFSLREPLARLESAYRFHNPLESCKPKYKITSSCDRMRKAQRNETSFNARFYLSCFPNIIAISKALEDPLHFLPLGPNAKNGTDCGPLLKGAFDSVGLSYYGHLSANHRFYEQAAKLRESPNKVVFVVRTEFLWEDVPRLDRLLGGDGDFSSKFGAKETPGSNYTERRMISLDVEQAQPICCAMEPDLRSFRLIVERASNLDTAQKRDTYGLIWKRCGVSSWEDMEQMCLKWPKLKDV